MPGFVDQCPDPLPELLRYQVVRVLHRRSLVRVEAHQRVVVVWVVAVPAHRDPPYRRVADVRLHLQPFGVDLLDLVDRDVR